MQLLPQQLTLAQLQVKWASILNVLLGNPVLDSSFIENVSLTTGANQVNHKLGRKLQGWSIVRYKGAWAEVYDTQDTNKIPELTLNLVSSAPVTISLVVF